MIGAGIPTAIAVAHTVAGVTAVAITNRRACGTLPDIRPRRAGVVTGAILPAPVTVCRVAVHVRRTGGPAGIRGCPGTAVAGITVTVIETIPRVAAIHIAEGACHRTLRSVDTGRTRVVTGTILPTPVARRTIIFFAAGVVAGIVCTAPVAASRIAVGISGTSCITGVVRAGVAAAIAVARAVA